ncbi:chromosome partition protein MukB [Thorsellia kenyensis]|uniref:Chromosome partition protein MukB n=1 Tax=Thorsellia kenyensis TaxID=1549888 RepID=A0ABV6CDL7_9GAMM
MIQRGKFKSLTLINWNGFFARTFDLDELVTTLSGGNGAGKSTTMAAFVTALIPDLTLLHFRNTTEAGATSSSRDRGLHGKLKPGVCYALLETVNSRNQRVIAGVRLQQVAGRDKKVDIKSFILQGLPTSIVPTEWFTEKVSESQARILALPELKDKCEAQDGIIFKQFNAITDYHAVMFDLGLLPKRLRSSSDRSKFYRLIEASLYGGISSAITRSLRDYLLPENSGVRKAFSDMESALRENRMTLEAIRVTQSDRDLFKHLIDESTQYVAADYMRHLNERKIYIEDALHLRQTLANSKRTFINEQYKQVELAKALHEITELEKDLEIDAQSAADHLSLVQNALRHQEKIERFSEESEELLFRLEEQAESVDMAQAHQFECEERTRQKEEEVDSLKSQLADFQQALDAQQTRVIQYQQALEALEKVRTIFSDPEMSVSDAEIHFKSISQQLTEITQKLVGYEQKKRLSEASSGQFEQAYQYVCSIEEGVSRKDAYQVGKKYLQTQIQHQHYAEQLTHLHQRINEIQQKLQQKQEASRHLSDFNQRYELRLTGSEIAEYIENAESMMLALEDSVTDANEKRIEIQQNIEHIKLQIQEQRRFAPTWLLAQEQLNVITSQIDESLESSNEITAYMQKLINAERELNLKREKINSQKEQIEQEIESLSQANGSDEQHLLQLAQKFGGVLLSEIYDDISLDDAPYFSALYGPARHAIVVPNLSEIRPQLDEVTDCPDDLYLIEGDPTSFDDSVFIKEELENAVLVKAADNQWRYSRFPANPLFGNAAREKRLLELSEQREQSNEAYAIVSFDLQKTQRLIQLVSQFVGEHLGVVFLANPEEKIAALQQQQNDDERALRDHQFKHQQQKQDFDKLKEQITILNRLLTKVDLLENDELVYQLEELKEKELEAQESRQFLQQHKATLDKLSIIIDALQSDPLEADFNLAEYDALIKQQTLLEQKLYALRELLQRKTYLSYAALISSGNIEEGESDLIVKLKEQLIIAEQERQLAREQLKQYQAAYNQATQSYASLKSAYDTKQDLLRELEQERLDIGIVTDEGSETRAIERRDSLLGSLNESRMKRSVLDRQIVACETAIETLNTQIKNDEKAYKAVRQLVNSNKIAWCDVVKLVKTHDIEKRLHKREYAYLDADTLRSMSDKALGSLRLAVMNNEHLRDVLRASEDPKYPVRKVQFYIAVYEHLKERIRQDIVNTDDPIDAIMQMEIELGRLTEELNTREKTLSISSQAVANIIRKTIHREQSRIRQLNQGLQSVAFGQVQSVRLNVNIRESHAILLDALASNDEINQDLFTNPKFSFSEALAKLYQRLHPQIDIGQKAPQTLGEELLDYRNYLEMEVEIFRGTDGWLRAESGALSTGEAIGTGMSILVMVVQSWEDESMRMRGKDMLPCRLLFLDEAARLDGKSIATLFELCSRLNMQLIIAAPENISPEQGTTYKLMRKVHQNHEYVHVVGLKGFESKE